DRAARQRLVAAIRRSGAGRMTFCTPAREEPVTIPPSFDISRRRALALLAGLPLAMAGCGRAGESAAAGGDLKDLRDRALGVSPPVSKLTIDDGRYLIALSLIHPDPVSLLSGWSGDVNRISPEMFAAFTERFP